MFLLALWFPLIGTFGIVLAVGGVIVSLMAFTGWKKVVLVSVCALLGVGELVSINRADQAHSVEVRNQGRDTENLQEQLRTSEANRRVDTAILQTKLDDYAALFRLVPAIMKIAETGAALEKRMVDTKDRSDHRFYETTMRVAKDIRDSSEMHDRIEQQQREQAMRLAHGLKSDSELMIDDMNRSVQLSKQRAADFQKLVLAKAAFLNELKNRLPPPTLDPQTPPSSMRLLPGVRSPGHTRSRKSPHTWSCGLNNLPGK